MSMNVTTRTGQDIATLVKRQFGDESGVQITDADLLRWINDGQRQINEQNKVFKAKSTTSSVAAQADYALPTGAASSIDSIHYNGIPVRALAYPEVEEYIMAYEGTKGSQGNPTVWYQWAGQVTFWPAPQSDNDTITILYTANPVELASLGDTLGLPDRYFNAIVQYVLSQAYEMDEDWDAANYKSQQFGVSLDQVADAERTTQEMTYPVITVIEDY